METDERLLALLDAEAWEGRPRVFALYGVYRHKVGTADDGAFLAYGMEFDDPPKAIMWEPGTTWYAESAAGILDQHHGIAEARLVWLEDPDEPTRDDYDLAGG